MYRDHAALLAAMRRLARDTGRLAESHATIGTPSGTEDATLLVRAWTRLLEAANELSAEWRDDVRALGDDCHVLVIRTINDDQTDLPI
jgi:hypothetical protein